MKKFSRLLIQLGQEVKYAPIYLCQDQNLFFKQKDSEELLCTSQVIACNNCLD